MRLARAVRNGKGFTLVELAIVLVIIGIILGAVLKGQDLIASSKAKRIQKDMQGFEAMIWTYYDRTGRLPGDCNSNGIVNSTPPPGATGTAPSNNATPTADYCMNILQTSETMNAPFSDLRSVGIAPRGTPNTVLAKHQMNDFYAIGSATVNTITYNAIVVYGIPTWMAKMIDVSIDGTVSGTAGRVRQYTTAAAGSAWPNDANNDTITSLIYYYDKSP